MILFEAIGAKSCPIFPRETEFPISIPTVSFPLLSHVIAVKEKRPIVIQWNLAAWIALYRT